MNPFEMFEHRVVPRSHDPHLKHNPRVRGYVFTDSSRIVIRDGLTMGTRLHVLLHEVGHIECGHTHQDNNLTHAEREFQANSFSYYFLVMNNAALATVFPDHVLLEAEEQALIGMINRKEQMKEEGTYKAYLHQ